MTPSQYRGGGTGEEIRFAVAQTSLGAILVGSSRKGVVAILLGNDPDKRARELQDRFPKACLIGADRDYEKLVAQVVGSVENPLVGLSLPLDIRGTVFQRQVWRALQKIPAGRTISYRDLARRIGSPQAVRAVADACAANKLTVAIPCHRVIRTDGTLSGYAWESSGSAPCSNARPATGSSSPSSNCPYLTRFANADASSKSCDSFWGHRCDRPAGPLHGKSRNHP